MDLLICEVVGCLQPATWVRITSDDLTREEYLCSGCWAKLRIGAPEQAGRYAPYEQEEPRASKKRRHNEDAIHEWRSR